MEFNNETAMEFNELPTEFIELTQKWLISIRVQILSFGVQMNSMKFNGVQRSSTDEFKRVQQSTNWKIR